MNNNDYRYTKYEHKNTNIIDDKKEFIAKIKLEHSKTVNHYSLISPNDGPYKKLYLKIYDNKCVYCGNSMTNLSIYLFEIDHYINKASFSQSEEKLANHINNLYPACKICNSKKSGITFVNEYVELFNPDNNIQNLFYRDEQYNIKIQEKYINDAFIKKFYERLKLDHTARRLDYLLLCMIGLATKTRGSSLSKELSQLIVTLQGKRNAIAMK